MPPLARYPYQISGTINSQKLWTNRCQRPFPVTFITGHTKDGMPDLDFAATVRAGGTLAIYMGLATLPKLRDGLLRHGLAPDTPSVLIEHGGDKTAPVRETPAKMRRRQMPEQLVAKMEIDPVDAVAARDQRPAQPIEEARDRALQK